MFPIGDERVQGGPPAMVTFGLIALNVLAFFVELAQPSEGALQSFIQAWGVVPREYSVARDLPPTIPLPFWSTLLTSMFLHGGWMHLGGNMLYLWIFGDNVEDRMGHVGFLIFYVISGIAAVMTHILLDPNSSVPLVGASGAIAGVLGAYLVLFPRARILSLIPFGFFSRFVHVPAIYFLPIWFVLQLISGLGSMVAGQAEGIAWWAHVGGFVAGMVLAFVFARRPRAAGWQ